MYMVTGFALVEVQGPTVLPSEAEARRRQQFSKVRAQGLSDFQPNETVVEAARQGASGPNKRATLKTCLLNKGELKSSSLLDFKRAKGSLPEKKHHR
jgi:hypothetical protein